MGASFCLIDDLVLELSRLSVSVCLTSCSLFTCMSFCGCFCFVYVPSLFAPGSSLSFIIIGSLFTSFNITLFASPIFLAMCSFPLWFLCKPCLVYRSLFETTSITHVLSNTFKCFGYGAECPLQSFARRHACRCCPFPLPHCITLPLPLPLPVCAIVCFTCVRASKCSTFQPCNMVQNLVMITLEYEAWLAACPYVPRSSLVYFLHMVT